MKNLMLIILMSLTTILANAQRVNVTVLDNIASELATIGQVNVSGQIYSSVRNSGGVAAISCQGNFCNIYAHPQAMSAKSKNTWAFIIGHELGHYILGHNGCGQGGKHKEMNADVVGARLANLAGYNLNNYLAALGREPESCSESHGCWSERINNLRQQFGYRQTPSHNCGNWVSRLAFPW